MKHDVIPFEDKEQPECPVQMYEDGTNIAFGTPFQLESATRRLPWYVPGEASGSSDWKRNIMKLRERFDKLIDDCCVAECIVIQSLIPRIGELDTSPPIPRENRKFLYSGPGLKLEASKLYGKQAPLCALFPMKNVAGQPLYGPDGSPVPFRLGLSRQIKLHAVPDGARSLPVPRLLELLDDGSKLLLQLPPEVAAIVWKNWSRGFWKQESKNLWLDALFELAWQREPGEPFHLHRFAWEGNGAIGLVGKGLFPRSPEFASRMSTNCYPHINGYPMAFYSKICDVSRASIDAIDQMLKLHSDSEMTLAKTPSAIELPDIYMPPLPDEIKKSLERFRSAHPEVSSTCFLMMRFADEPTLTSISNTIQSALSDNCITCLRADEKEFHNHLPFNIQTYLHGCGFGIAVFERLKSDSFNANVAFEVGYLKALGKEVLLLKEKSLLALQSDLAGHLYHEFDAGNIPGTIPVKIKKWLADKGLGSPNKPIIQPT